MELKFRNFLVGTVVIFQMTSAKEYTFDVLIQNARIVDGTGAPWFHGSVGVIGDKIVKVGRISQESILSAKSIIDAKGCYLAPGFLDSHTHDDVAILDHSGHPSKILQGVSTIITGNCGFSNYPNGENAGVQSHLSSLLGEIHYGNFFQNFSSYKLELYKGTGPNVGSLVGHGPIRISVTGHENRHATEEEIAIMQDLLEEQLQQGSLGLSLGLVYPPSAFASQDELLGLASIVAKYDRVLSAHIRSYEGNLLRSIDEFLTILKISGARGLLSHLQVAGVPYWGEVIPVALEKLEAARMNGIDVAVDMYPYLAGSSTILQLLPPSALSGGFDELVRKLESDHEFVAILKELTENGTEPGWESKVRLIGWDNVIINSVVNEELIGIQGLTILQGARRLGFATEFEFYIFVILEDKGRSNIIMFQQSEEDQRQVFGSRLTAVGSDSIPRVGKPHPRMYGTFPRVVGNMALVNGVMPLEEAVRKATSMPAQRFGIWDRGIIRPQMKADLVLFTEAFSDTATYDLPVSHPTGVEGVWVNGIRVVENGTSLGILSGVVLTP